MTTIHLTNEQQIRVFVAPKTAKGKPAKIDGKPTWSITSGDSTMEVADDGLSALLVTSDTEGVTEYHVEADADLGEGIVTLVQDLALDVKEPQAAALDVTVGTPEDKPDATAPALLGDVEKKPKSKKKH